MLFSPTLPVTYVLVLDAHKGHRSLKDMFKMTKSFKSASPDYNTSIHLFDALVKPIMVYGSEISGPFLLKGGDINFVKLLLCELEKCHQKCFHICLWVE